MNRIELEVVDIKNSKNQGDAFALILKEKGGERLFPIFIGLSEARAVALQLNQIKPLRPSTHDLFSNFADQCGFKINNVRIVNYADGIFYSSIFLTDDQGQQIELDSRTSDAVTLALKTSAPIFINDELLETVSRKPEPKNTPRFFVADEDSGKGIEVGQDNENIVEDIVNEEDEAIEDDKYIIQKLKEMSLDELQNLLDGVLECEDYEMASRIKEEMERRNK
ncbi:MAG: bifunctional nuclease family protein [Bacteroidales bacterium]|nr:bifunctional nuclease family protein [Bacteroidales bacterium]